MRILAPILASALVFVLTASPAEAAKKKKQVNDVNGDVAGTVVSVIKGEGSDSTSSVTVKIAAAKKKAAATEKKFELSKGAKLETLTASKKAFAVKSATIDSLKAGDRVLVQVKDGKNDQADRVLVIASGQKKKPAAAN